MGSSSQQQQAKDMARSLQPSSHQQFQAQATNMANNKCGKPSNTPINTQAKACMANNTGVETKGKLSTHHHMGRVTRHHRHKCSSSHPSLTTRVGSISCKTSKHPVGRVGCSRGKPSKHQVGPSSGRSSNHLASSKSINHQMARVEASRDKCSSHPMVRVEASSGNQPTMSSHTSKPLARDSSNHPMGRVESSRGKSSSH